MSIGFYYPAVLTELFKQKIDEGIPLKSVLSAVWFYVPQLATH
jgi:hypothetical protein